MLFFDIKSRLISKEQEMQNPNEKYTIGGSDLVEAVESNRLSIVNIEGKWAVSDQISELIHVGPGPEGRAVSVFIADKLYDTIDEAVVAWCGAH